MRSRWVSAVVLALGITFAKPAPSEPAQRPDDNDASRAVAAIVADKTLSRSKVGISIVDLETGKVLAAHNEREAMNPASNAKLYTAAAALSLIGPAHRYETALIGSISGEAITTGLTIRGYGDPSLRTADLAGLVQELVGLGIRSVDGDILVDQAFFDDVYTPPAFEQQPNEWAYFRAPVSAIALNRNTITATMRPKGKSSSIVTFDPPGFVDAEGSVKHEDGGPESVKLALSPQGQRLKAKLAGSFSTPLYRITKRVEDPTLLAGYALRSLLESAGIKVSGEVKSGKGKGHAIVRHQSATLSELLFAVGKNSDNFYAEMIFKTLGGEAKGRPASSANAADVVTHWLESEQLLTAGTVIKNGSGLFDANRVTAAGVTSLLKRMAGDPKVATEYMAQLAVSGVDGTLQRRLRGPSTRGFIRAKTGTLNDTIALSGYVLRKTKRPIAFSILFNGVGGKQDSARAAADKLVTTLARD
jgi:D-alanyl-D-alanine carboxypeptidase/D-alanyl-D-alanine-endopeptidase (penicillin-binding protein 4)